MTEKSKKILLWLLDLIINIGIIFILVIVIQKWIVAPFDVSGSSMCDTLNLINGDCKNGYGEKIIINEAGYKIGEPERGDIVVFKAPGEENEEEKYFIKRIIGLPGDTVEIKNGEVYITPNGKENSIKIDEPYLNLENKGKTKIYFSNFSVFKVPESHYFLLGDNRHSSTDSRSCFQSSLAISCKDTPEKAFINKKDIRGKTWVVWWPLQNIRIIKHQDYPELEDTDNQESSESRAEK